MKLVGANPATRVVGLEQLPGKVNYFIGNDPARWRTNIATFAKVRYEQVYPGIDLVYYGHEGQLEYDFIVASGANPGLIKLAFNSAEKMEVDSSGDLVLHVAGRQVRWRKPVVYQLVDGIRREVEARYVLGSETLGACSATFELGAYDRSQPLVIDPVLVYSTFYGGSGIDVARQIAVDSEGSVYLAGQTSSADFARTDAFQSILKGEVDVLVAKLNPSGTAVVYSTYVGGTGVEPSHGRSDVGQDLAVDQEGNVYVVGWTRSTDFPLVNPLQPDYAGGTASGTGDGFVFKLNATGNALLYSTFLGGAGDDECNSIDVDPQGYAYLTGLTGSKNFPVTNAIQALYRGDLNDVFVTKLNPTRDRAGLLHFPRRE